MIDGFLGSSITGNSKEHQNGQFGVVHDINNVNSREYSESQAILLFNKNSIMRLYMYYHNINSLIVKRYIYRREAISVGTIEILHINTINSNSIFIGCCIKIYNVSKLLYIGDIVNNNNINFNVLLNSKVGYKYIVCIPHCILFNRSNRYGVSINDFILLDRSDINNIYYDNIDNVEFLYNNITIRYYGYIINNNISRSELQDINQSIVNKYLYDISINNNSSFSVKS